MTNGDYRKRLAATLADVGVGTDPDTLDRIFTKLMRIRQTHIARVGATVPGGGGRPSEALLKVAAALHEWVPPPAEYHAWTVEQVMIHQFDPVKMEAIDWLKRATKEAIEQIETARPKVRTETPTTTLLRLLYHLYQDETGKSGLTDGGPAHRFVAGCARIVYHSANVPETGFRQRLQAERQGKSPKNKNPGSNLQK
jgi:hypothetical protein